MKKFAVCLAACATLMAPVTAMAKDVALVIANINDAGFSNERALREAIPPLVQGYRADGFETLVGNNANATDLDNLFRDFESQSRTADRVVIHFVGRISETAQSFILRPNGRFASTYTGQYQDGVNANLVYDLLAHRPGRSAFVLSIPSGSADRQIERGPDIPQGLLVLSGPAEHLSNAIRRQLLQQDKTGREMAALRNIAALGFVSDFALDAGQTSVAAANPTPNSTAADAALVEMRVWREATQAGTRDALEGYIARYPNGLFLGEARARLIALAPQKSLEETIEEGLRLTRDDRRKIQRNLTFLGFNTRGVDGLFGRGTRSAIERWQRSEGFRSSGFLDAAQIRVLDDKARQKSQADQQAREREDLSYWQATGSGSSEQGLKDYLAKFPEGLFAPQAKQSLARIENENRNNNQQVYIQRERALKMTPQTRKLVEQRLAGLGYEVGTIDDKFTRETRYAIADFQRKSGLPDTGYMDNQTVTRLVASIFR